MNKIEALEKLQHLKEIGALTDEEFEKEKSQILSDTDDKVNDQPSIAKEQGKVIIHSYNEFYIVNPDVKVYIDDNLITSLSKGQNFEYPISKTTTITFKVGIITANATVSPNAITEIRLIWNRKTGLLETVCNEQNFNGINNCLNKQTYQEKINIKKHSSNVWLFIGLVRRSYTVLYRFVFSFLKNRKKLFYKR